MEWLSFLFSISTGGVDFLTAGLGIGTIMTIIGTVIAAASAATSAGMAAKQAKDARSLEERNRAEVAKERRTHEDLFNRRYHQDMTERTEVQSMLRELREKHDQQRNQNEARGAVLGETQEQQIARQQGLNKAYADSVAGITRNASALKDGYLDDYEKNLTNYYQQNRDMNTRMSQMAQNSSNQWATAANNAMNAAVSAAGIAAGMAGQEAPANVNISNGQSTSEAIHSTPSRSGQFEVAQKAATSPLEKGIYGDLANVARQTEVTQPVSTPPRQPQSVVEIQWGKNPWELQVPQTWMRNY